MPPVTDLADRFHDALERQDVQSLERIVRAYAGVQSRVSAEIDALALEIERSGSVTPNQLRRMERYRNILALTQDEVDKFTRFMDVELAAQGSQYVARGVAESRALLIASVNGERALVASFRDLNPTVVERLLGFLAPDGPLYARLKLLPKYVADAAAQTILNFVALGKNPRTLACELTRAYGMGLTDSLRMARTVQLYAYREASRANYVANQHVVRGWQWYARLDNLTCMSCVAQHGKIYPLDQRLNDHYNGKCIQLPITILTPNGEHIAQDAGEQWFNGLSEAQQRAMMGAGKFEAWREGRFAFDALSHEHDDAVYGLMRSVTSLKDLISGQD